MKSNHFTRLLACLLLSVGFASLPFSVSSADDRVLVDMPAMMRDHMLGNMRDHLLALQEITHFLSIDDYGSAADTAEGRLGMSSLERHGASHMARVMPDEMAEIGTAMHRAASRFAVSVKDAEIQGDLNAAFSALSQVMQQCVACHAAFRVNH